MLAFDLLAPYPLQLILFIPQFSINSEALPLATFPDAQSAPGFESAISLCPAAQGHLSAVIIPPAGIFAWNALE